MRKAINFLKQTRAELDKVVWPTRLKALKLTLTVVVITAIFGLFITAVDFGLGKGIQFVVDSQGKQNSSGQQTQPGQQGLPEGLPGQPGQGQPGGQAPVIPAPGDGAAQPGAPAAGAPAAGEPAVPAPAQPITP